MDKNNNNNKNAVDAGADVDERAQPGSSSATTLTPSETQNNGVDDKSKKETGVAEESPPPAKELSPEETRTTLQTFVIMVSLCAVCSISNAQISSNKRKCILTYSKGSVLSGSRCHHHHHSPAYYCGTIQYGCRLYLGRICLSSDQCSLDSILGKTL